MYILLFFLFLIILLLGPSFLLLPILHAFLAKHIASCYFVSGRSMEEIIKTELKVALFRLPSIKLDTEHKIVSVSSWGAFRKQAYYHPARGCSLYQHKDIIMGQDLAHENIRRQEVEKARIAAAEQSFWQEQLSPWMHTQPSQTLAMYVMHRGRCVAEAYAEGIQPHTPLPGWSMAKSVTSALVGIMVKQGLIDIHDPLPKEIWQGPVAGRERISMHHLLQMSGGLPWTERYWWASDVTRMLFASKDASKIMSAKVSKFAPGTYWQYASGTTNLISRVLRVILKEDYHRFPYQQLFAPLGMDTALIETDAAGNFVGSSYMLASAADWAKFGQLYIKDGLWQGKRILAEGWVDYTKSPASAAPHREYGAHFWLNQGLEGQSQTRKMPDVPQDVYYASGFGGQRIFILPSQELVIVRLANAHFREPDFNHLLATLLGNLEQKQQYISKTDINHNL